MTLVISVCLIKASEPILVIPFPILTDVIEGLFQGLLVIAPLPVMVSTPFSNSQWQSASVAPHEPPAKAVPEKTQSAVARAPQTTKFFLMYCFKKQVEKPLFPRDSEVSTPPELHVLL